MKNVRIEILMRLRINQDVFDLRVVPGVLSNWKLHSLLDLGAYFISRNVRIFLQKELCERR